MDNLGALPPNDLAKGAALTTASLSGRLSLGSLLAQALRFARRRWLELLGLFVCVDWAPRVILVLSGVGHYTLGSHDVGAFSASAVQSTVLVFCSSLTFASVMAVGLGGSREPVTGPIAITRVLQRLPALAPWWLALAVPNAVIVWLRWSVGSVEEMRATYYFREFGGTAYDVVLSCLLALFPLVVFAEDLGGSAALRRTLKLMTGQRRIVFVVVFAADAVGLMINLSTPYLALIAPIIGIGRDYEQAYYPIYFTTTFVWEAVAVVSSLVFVQLYDELARAHDGVAPGELAHIFA